MKAVINGWPTLFQFLLPFAQEESVDFNAPLPTVDQEPFNRRPLLHNLVCTPHCNLDILKILLFEVQVDVNQKDLNGCSAVELAVSRIPNNHEQFEYDKPLVLPMHGAHLKAISMFLQRRDFDIKSYKYDFHYREPINTGPRHAIERKDFWSSMCRTCCDSMIEVHNGEGYFGGIVYNFNHLPFHEMYDFMSPWHFEHRGSAYWLGHARDHYWA